MFTQMTRYELIDKLGEGGMGVVYEAYDRVRDMRLALKALRNVNDRSIYRFKREFRALSNLSHPNIIHLYELVSDGAQWFLTMELVQGEDIISYVRAGRLVETTSSPVRIRGTLDEEASTADTRVSELAHDQLRHQGSMSSLARLPTPLPRRASVGDVVDLERLRAMLRQLADALHTLHTASLAHRDLKPSNVLVTSRGRLVLMDFGVVGDLQADRDKDTGTTYVGTPQYMAPEQARGNPATAAADWYALGVLLYVALTGRLPYEGVGFQVMQLKQARDPLAPSLFTADIPPDLERLCMELLRRDPEARPAGPEVLARLGAIVRHAAGSGEFPMLDASTRLFVGRVPELALLREAYAAVKDEATRRVLVQGPSGMGKTALLDRFLWELCAQQHARPIVLSGRCHERESLAYKAFDGVIDDLSRHLQDLPPERRQAALPTDARLIARMFPALMPALDHPQQGAEPGARSPVQQRHAAVAALRALLCELARDQPVIIRIEDLQWADPDSVELLCGVFQPPAPRSLLLVATLRTEEIEGHAPHIERAVATLATQPDCQIVHVLPLAPAEQRELLDRMAALPQFCSVGRFKDSARWAELEGHPMLLIELARSAPDASDELVRAGHLCLETFLWTRISRLPADARALMECVALAGRPLPLSVLARAAALPAPDGERACTVLRVGNLARITRNDTEPWLVSYHDKIREAVITHTSPQARRALHHRIALALEEWDAAPADALADQWQAAGEPIKSARYLYRAARAAAEILAFDRAAGFYRQVLETTEPHAGDPGLELIRCRSFIGLAEGMRIVDRDDEVLAMLHSAQRIATAHDLAAELADIHYMRGNFLFPRGDMAGCLREHQRARAYARAAGSPEREARALSGIGDAHYLGGRMISAYQSFDHCVTLSRAHEFADIEAANLSMRGMTRFYQNDFATALQDSLNAAAAAARSGHKRAEIVARSGCTSWILYEMDDLEQCRRELTIALELTRALGARRFLPNSLTLLAKIAVQEGRRADAQALAGESVATCRDTSMMRFVGPMALGALAMATDDAGERERALAEAQEILAAGAASYNHLHFHRDAMDAALAAGDAGALEHHAAALEAYTQPEPLPWSQLFIARARALADHLRGRGDRARMQALLDEACRVGMHLAARALRQALAV